MVPQNHTSEDSDFGYTLEVVWPPSLTPGLKRTSGCGRIEGCRRGGFPVIGGAQSLICCLEDEMSPKRVSGPYITLGV